MYAHVISLILQSAAKQDKKRDRAATNTTYLPNELGKVPWKFVHEQICTYYVRNQKIKIFCWLQFLKKLKFHNKKLGRQNFFKLSKNIS